MYLETTVTRQESRESTRNSRKRKKKRSPKRKGKLKRNRERRKQIRKEKPMKKSKKQESLRECEYTNNIIVLVDNQKIQFNNKKYCSFLVQGGCEIDENKF